MTSVLLISTVLLLIRIFLEYCQCVNDIPSISTDMLTRLSDLLKVTTHHPLCGNSLEGWSESWLHLPGKHPTNKLPPCCIEWSLTPPSFDSTSTRGAASWSWGQEHYKWWDSRPSPLKTWVCTRACERSVLPNFTRERSAIHAAPVALSSQS